MGSVFKIFLLLCPWVFVAAYDSKLLASKTDDGYEGLLPIGYVPSDCGEIVTDASGTIKSPKYPMPSNTTGTCIWRIVVAEGSLIQIDIADLDVETTNGCGLSYLAITDGLVVRSPSPSERFCNSTKDYTYVSESNIVTIQFLNNDRTSHRGFRLNYKTNCYRLLTGLSGTVTSPNYPKSAPLPATCGYTIQVPFGNRVNLVFSDFKFSVLPESSDSTICPSDYLRVDEGTDGTPKKELATFCGWESLPQQLISSMNEVYIVYNSNKGLFSGFRMEWAVDGCGGHFRGPSGIIEPLKQSTLLGETVCTWLIEVDVAYSVQLKIQETDFEPFENCTEEAIKIYDGDSTDGLNLANVCYIDDPAIVTSTGNKMYIRHIIKQNAPKHSFIGSYSRVEPQCGGLFSSPRGGVHSTNYPKNYPDNQVCQWLITVDENQLVNLTFQDFDIASSYTNCTDDYVKILDGNSTDAPELDTLCGNRLPPSYVSSGNEMLVIMKSDEAITGSGFKASYTRICGARITVESDGQLSAEPSLGFFDETVNCTWVLKAKNPGDQITLQFTHLDLGDYSMHCGPDQLKGLKVFDGDGTNGKLLANLCGPFIPLPIVSSGDTLTLQLFRIDMLRKDISYKGLPYSRFSQFDALYSVKKNACGGELATEAGTFSSPKYPLGYLPSTQCIWTIPVNPGQQLELLIEEIDIKPSLGCNLDHLEIREDNGIGKLLYNLCSNQTIKLMSQKPLWLEFRSSDGLPISKGFKASYKYETENVLYGPYGDIYSPLYPKPYTQNVKREWLVKVGQGKILNLDVKDFRAAGSKKCQKGLKIYDGAFPGAPLLKILCGNIEPQTIVSSGSEIRIVLFADQDSIDLLWFHLSWLEATPNEPPVSSNRECVKRISLMNDENVMVNISSPGWPDNYDNNLDCTWVITSPVGTHVAIKFLKMFLETSTGCVKDYVSVYSGDVTQNNATLLGTLCRLFNRHTIFDGSNVLSVRFKSDATISRRGFLAVVYRDCGGELTASSGEINLSNLTKVGSSRIGFDCEWLVSVPQTRDIFIDVLDIDMPDNEPVFCKNNYVALKDGGSLYSHNLGKGKYCGPKDSFQLRSRGNQFYVRVQSANRNIRFLLLYRASIPPSHQNIYIKPKESAVIQTLNYPNIPETFTDFTWNLYSTAGDPLSLTFIDRFQLEWNQNCTKEFVELRDGTTNTSRILGRFCASDPPGTFMSSGPSMSVRYYTAEGVPMNGFRANVTSGICGGIIRADEGIISPPNYPLTYPGNIECVWHIIPPSGLPMRLEFPDLQLPGRMQPGECQNYDNIFIGEYKNLNDSIQKIGVYCGQNKPKLITSVYNHVVIKFRSLYKDLSRNYDFKFRLKFQADNSVLNCNEEFIGTRGEIQSPNYPRSLDYKIYCTWIIKVPSQYRVVLNVEDWKGRSGSLQSVKFYNDILKDSFIRSISGNDTDPQVIESTSNIMVLYYYGDRHFRATYRAVSPALCGGTKIGPTGVILPEQKKPLSESTYRCVYDLVLAGNSTQIPHLGTVTLALTGQVGTPELCKNFSSQGIHVYGFFDTPLLYYCGIVDKVAYYRIPGNYFHVEVINTTNALANSLKFNLSYSWQECGGILRGPQDTLVPPQDLVYPANCAWHIKYPSVNGLLRFSFSEMQLGPCSEEYLVIRRLNEFVPKEKYICGNNIPQEIVVQDNSMWIEYYSLKRTGSFKIDINQTQICGGNINVPHKNVTSPGFPGLYPRNSDCIWQFQSLPGFHVGLSFMERFDLEFSEHCNNDYIELLDFEPTPDILEGGLWKPIGKMCGREQPISYRSTANLMRAVFHSNQAIEGNGFEISSKSICGSTYLVTSEPQILDVPQFWRTSDSGLECKYKFIAPQQQEIVFEFNVFECHMGYEDCPFNNVTVYSGAKPETYCGGMVPSIFTSRTELELIFRTDVMSKGISFQATYYIPRL